MGGFAGGLESSLRLGIALSRQRDADRYRQDALALSRDQLEQRITEHEDRVAQWDVQNEAAVRQDFIASYQAGSSRMAAEASAKQADIQGERLKIEQEEEGRQSYLFDQAQVRAEGAKVFGGLQNKGIFNPQTGNIDVDAFAERLSKGEDSAFPQLVLQTLNLSNVGAPEGFTFKNVEVLGDGRFIFSGSYGDDDTRRGALTTKGGISDGEELPVLTARDVAGLVRDNFYQLIPNTPLGAIDKDGNMPAFSEYMTRLGASQAAVNDAVANVRATATVLNAVDELGPEASRAFRGALAKATDENERRAVLRDFASTKLNLQLDLPDAAPATEIIGSIAEPGVPVAAALGGMSDRGYEPPAAERRGSAQREVNRLDSQITDLESQAAQATGARKERIMGQITELDAKRQELVQRTNTQSLEAVTARIKDLTAKRDKARGPRQAYWQEQIDAATQEKRELERGMGVVTPAMETEAYKKLESDVFARLDGMSNDEVKGLVDSGAITFAPDQVAAMRQRAQELGGSIADVRRKATPPEQAAFYALLAATAKSPAERQSLDAAWMNVTETGTPSISAKDAATLEQRAQEGATARDRLNFEIEQYMAAELKDVEALRPAISKAINDVLFVAGADGSRVPREGKEAPLQFARETFPLLLARIGDAKRLTGPNLVGEEKVRVLKEEAARGLSIAMNRIADSQGGDVWQRIKRFFGGIASEDYTLSGLDFDLDRIRFGAVNSKGQPQSFVYASSSGTPGNRIPASLIRNLGDEFYDAMYAAAKRNEDR